MYMYICIYVYMHMRGCHRRTVSQRATFADLPVKILHRGHTERPRPKQSCVISVYWMYKMYKLSKYAQNRADSLQFKFIEFIKSDV